MNKRTAKKVISKKISDWFKSIKDEKVKSLCEKNVIVTGGSITSLLLGEDVKDFDIYFKTKETVIAVANYYTKQWRDSGGDLFEVTEDEETGRIAVYIPSKGVAGDIPEETEHFEDPYDLSNDVKEEKEKFRPVFFSSNAITLSDKIQLVLRFYGEAEEIHKNYDFAHCTNYWESSNSTLTLKQVAIEAILAKELIYCGSLYPICSVIRTRKFIKRGWNINAGQYLKMAFQISQLNLTDLKVLQDQLTGVDSAYFMTLIEALKNVETEITPLYVIEIIDRIFN